MPIFSAAPTYHRGGVGRPQGGGGGVAWLTPYNIPGFKRAKLVQPGSRDFVSLMGLAVAAGRRGLGATDPCGNTGEVLYNGVCTLPQYVPANAINVLPSPATSGGGSPTAVPANCPVVGAPGPDAYCDYGGEIIGCREVRECDSMTGVVHFEYLTPGGAAGNPDISVVDPSTGQVTGCLDKTGAGGGTLCNLPVGVTLVDPATGAQVYKPTTNPTGGGGSTGGDIPPCAALPRAVASYEAAGLTDSQSVLRLAQLRDALAKCGGAAGSGAIVPVTLTFVNTSRAGMPLQVGDSWSLTVMGSASTPVSGDATKDGAVVGTGTVFGTTDGQGKLVITGKMTPDTAGRWHEVFHVGSQSAVLDFTVAPAPGGGSTTTPPASTGGGGSTSTGGTPPPGDNSGVSNSGCFSIVPAGTFGTMPASFAFAQKCIGPADVLTWAALAAAAYFFFGRKGR